MNRQRYLLQCLNINLSWISWFRPTAYYFIHNLQIQFINSLARGLVSWSKSQIFKNVPKGKDASLPVLNRYVQEKKQGVQ